MKKQVSHVAFILDGNKRWAEKKALNNFNGYLSGFENIKNIVNHSYAINIPNLTLFNDSALTFSIIFLIDERQSSS